MDVSGKIAIVTGGGSGIGLEFVKLLIQKKCSVVIADLTLTEHAQEVIKENKDAKILFHKTDVTDWRQLENLFAFTEKELGVADIVVPGAGVFEPAFSNFWNDSEEQSYKTIQVNIEHPTKVTRLAIRALVKANKPGSILLISSIGAQTTRLAVPIYCATKAYINHFIRAFAALEEHENIRVFGIAPGLVATPLWFKHNPEKLKTVGSLDHWIQPVEIAQVMLQMIEQAEYKGGEIVEVAAKGQIRKVEQFNDPGPTGIGGTQGANTALEDEVFKALEKERGS